MEYRYIYLFISSILCLTSSTVAIMDCLKNRDCLNRHEHLCNMQNGMWTRNYVLQPKNTTSFEEQLDSCSCCFLPDIFKTKSSQRSLLESVLTLESVTSYLVTGRPKPCAPLRKACNVTSDCCTGYCSVIDEYSFPGYCTDPNMAMFHTGNNVGVTNGNANPDAEAGYRFNRGSRFQASSTTEKERTTKMESPDKKIL